MKACLSMWRHYSVYSVNWAAVTVSEMESGVDVVSQTQRVAEPQQARKRLQQLAEEARKVGLANSSHAEAPSAAASSSDQESYGAEVRLSNLVIRF